MMKRQGPTPNAARNAQILALRGRMSTQSIADRLDLPLGAVSGVCFRASHPLLVRGRHTGTRYPRIVRKPVSSVTESQP